MHLNLSLNTSSVENHNEIVPLQVYVILPIWLKCNPFDVDEKEREAVQC